jgi:hypothetical protein
MPVSAPQVREVSTNEVRIISADFKGKLDEGELLTGTPTITEVSTDHLTLSSKQVSTVELVVNQRRCAIGEVAQFKVDASGAAPGTTYEVDIICGTDRGQTIDGRISIYVRD